MVEFVIRRLIHAGLVMLAVSMFVFVLMHLGGDPAISLVSEEATPEQIQAVRERMGFDRPIPVQYGLFLGRILQGDFGYSWRNQQPAFSLIIDRVPATLRLLGATLTISLAIGLPVGIIAALKRNSIVDRLSMAFVLFGHSMPTFWFGIMAIFLFALRLDWLPTSGYQGLQYIILPALTLGFYTSAVIARVLRSSLIEVFGRDYIRTARAKGLSEGLVLVRHALKNAALPVITVVGLQAGYLVGGSIVTETVFSYPGMGLLAINSIRSQDIPVVQAFVITLAGVIVLTNLAVDILYRYVDPRIRY